MPDYLDTSAFIKLVRSEPESPALRLLGLTPWHKTQPWRTIAGITTP